MLPRALRPMLGLACVLRRHGFAVAPDQTIGFIAAVGALGPRGIEDIRRAARALFAIPPERMAEFDALFRAVFLSETLTPEIAGAQDDDEVEVHEPTGASTQIEIGDAQTEIGDVPTGAERLGTRRLAPEDAGAALAAFARAAPKRLPRRLSYRHAAARHGDALDMRRMLREAVRRDGEVMRLFETRRKTRQRRILLLIDVSGSMKARTEGAMRFAHTLAQAAERAEVFTLGTRLTRVTPALGVPDRALALARAAGAVADFDGGTRIGDALGAYLNVPRYAGFARGAAIVVLSDGLERGAPDAMIDAVRRLSRLAWRLDWLTPLAADPFYLPQTPAMAGILPWLDALGDGDGAAAVAAHVLNLARAA